MAAAEPATVAENRIAPTGPTPQDVDTPKPTTSAGDNQPPPAREEAGPGNQAAQQEAAPREEAAPGNQAAQQEAAPPTQATPAAQEAAQEATQEEAPATDTPTPWWTRAPTGPAWLAEVAVERLGDSAERYVRWLRETYPQADADGLARVVVARAERRAAYTAVLGGPAAGLAALALQAEVVLQVAAAYGRDPRDPDRVPEVVELVAPLGAAVMLAGLVRRVLPGAGVVTSLLASRAAVERAGRRARERYRDSRAAATAKGRPPHHESPVGEAPHEAGERQER